MYTGVVTPCVGVWIETWTDKTKHQKKSMSHPAWVCGLKLPARVTSFTVPQVTPCVGVWIETGHHRIDCDCSHRHTLRGCVD